MEWEKKKERKKSIFFIWVIFIQIFFLLLKWCWILLMYHELAILKKKLENKTWKKFPNNIKPKFNERNSLKAVPNWKKFFFIFCPIFWPPLLMIFQIGRAQQAWSTYMPLNRAYFIAIIISFFWKKLYDLSWPARKFYFFWDLLQF